MAPGLSAFLQQFVGPQRQARVHKGNIIFGQNCDILAIVQAKGGILREAPGLSAFLLPLPFHNFFSLYPESTQL